MRDVIRKIIHGEDVEQIIENVTADIYKRGPDDVSNMEILCYLSMYQTEIFGKWEKRILKYMGLNYKKIVAEYFPDVIFGMYQKHIEEQYQYTYTPVQASIIAKIENNACFSFSAPTSTGKSYVFRNIICESKRDVVIVVPSRALINEYYSTLCKLIKDKSVNILTFIDKINTKNAKRTVFIVTPERCKELFRHKEDFDVEIFLFDEAQLSNEQSSRGLYFDSIIRRAQKAYDKAKFIFAHPFVENPEAQIMKNHFGINSSDAICYKYRNVGQIFYAIENNKFYHFGIDKEVMGTRKILCTFDPLEQIIRENGSILVYTTKASIYNKHVFKEFNKYIKMCPEITDNEAKNYIRQIQKYIGANDNREEERYSQMISLMKCGIVIHHGSLPLQARLVLEQFTRAGFCRICFATSTLEQGINMPFDVVYLNTFEASRPLSLKNLIGRAGRSSLKIKFDFGAVIVKSCNMSKLRDIMHQQEVLETISMLEMEVDPDLQEFKDAVLEGTISDEYNITENQLENLKSLQSEEIILNILDAMFYEGNIISLKIINNDRTNQLKIYLEFQKLYECFLGRDLCDGERNILSTAIKILLWQVHCKSFKDICFYRYSYASQKQERDLLKKQMSEGNQFDQQLAKIKLDNLWAGFVTEYGDIPNKQAPVYSMFGNMQTRAMDVDYDRIVFDTYDYLDKIIGFRLSDIFFAAFMEYNLKTNDDRAKQMACLIKYGTEKEKEIWMLRYGFSFEDIEWLEPYIDTISQEEIIFTDEIERLSAERTAIIERFM